MKWNNNNEVDRCDRWRWSSLWSISRKNETTRRPSPASRCIGEERAGTKAKRKIKQQNTSHFVSFFSCMPEYIIITCEYEESYSVAHQQAYLYETGDVLSLSPFIRFIFPSHRLWNKEMNLWRLRHSCPANVNGFLLFVWRGTFTCACSPNWPSNGEKTTRDTTYFLPTSHNHIHFKFISPCIYQNLKKKACLCLFYVSRWKETMRL